MHVLIQPLKMSLLLRLAAARRNLGWRLSIDVCGTLIRVTRSLVGFDHGRLVERITFLIYLFTRESENEWTVLPPVSPQDAENLFLRGLMTSGLSIIGWPVTALVKEPPTDAWPSFLRMLGATLNEHITPLSRDIVSLNESRISDKIHHKDIRLNVDHKRIAAPNRYSAKRVAYAGVNPNTPDTNPVKRGPKLPAAI